MSNREKFTADDRVYIEGDMVQSFMHLMYIGFDKVTPELMVLLEGMQRAYIEAHEADRLDGRVDPDSSVISAETWAELRICMDYIGPEGKLLEWLQP